MLWIETIWNKLNITLYSETYMEITIEIKKIQLFCNGVTIWCWSSDIITFKSIFFPFKLVIFFIFKKMGVKSCLKSFIPVISQLKYFISSMQVFKLTHELCASKLAD